MYMWKYIYQDSVCLCLCVTSIWRSLQVSLCLCFTSIQRPPQVSVCWCFTSIRRSLQVSMYLCLCVTYIWRSLHFSVRVSLSFLFCYPYLGIFLSMCFSISYLDVTTRATFMLCFMLQDYQRDECMCFSISYLDVTTRATFMLCLMLQDYQKDECMCRCSNMEDKHACEKNDMLWDQAACKCTCKEEEQCSTGFFWVPQFCR